MINEAIQKLLNKPYGADLVGQSRKYVCWTFCQEVYSLLGLELQQSFHERNLTRIPAPTLNCIVLFQMAGEWHAGIVYPDTLHFIHASPLNPHDRDNTEYVACKEHLTGWPYKLAIEGYYAP
ncbi:hypothetical protein ES703_28872 [subsurface metagenome]